MPVLKPVHQQQGRGRRESLAQRPTLRPLRFFFGFPDIFPKTTKKMGDHARKLCPPPFFYPEVPVTPVQKKGQTTPSGGTESAFFEYQSAFDL